MCLEEDRFERASGKDCVSWYFQVPSPPPTFSWVPLRWRCGFYSFSKTSNQGVTQSTSCQLSSLVEQTIASLQELGQTTLSEQRDESWIFHILNKYRSTSNNLPTMARKNIQDCLWMRLVNCLTLERVNLISAESAQASHPASSPPLLYLCLYVPIYSTIVEDIRNIR